ncbi:MAG: hypothetical protein AAF530_23285 [Pseudomonadota bacterium]
MATIRKKDISSSNKNKILILVCALAIASYFGLHYQQLSKDVQHEENMINRRLNRMETRLQAPPEPTISPAVLEQRLAALDESLQTTRTSLAQLSAQFVPLDAMDRFQTLRLEISNLAEDNRLAVERITGLSEGGQTNGTNEVGNQVLEDAAKNRFGRPLVLLVARGRFGGIMRFLEQLETMSYNVSVVRLNIAAAELNEGEDQRRGQPLALDILMAL